MFRIAITGDDDVVFQWHGIFESPETAQAQIGAAKAEYAGHTVVVQELLPVDDENSEWSEVTE